MLGTKRVPETCVADLFEQIPEFPEKIEAGDTASLLRDVSALLPRLKKETDHLDEVEAELLDRHEQLDFSFEKLASKLQIILISQLLLREVIYGYLNRAEARPADGDTASTGGDSGTAGDSSTAEAGGPPGGKSATPSKIEARRGEELKRFYQVLDESGNIILSSYNGLASECGALSSLRAYVAEGLALFSDFVGSEQCPQLPDREDVSRKSYKARRGVQEGAARRQDSDSERAHAADGTPSDNPSALSAQAADATGTQGAGEDHKLLPQVRAWLSGPPEKMPLLFDYSILNTISATTLPHVCSLFIKDWERRERCAEAVLSSVQRQAEELQTRLELLDADWGRGQSDIYTGEQLELSRAMKKRVAIRESLQDIRASDEHERMGIPSSLNGREQTIGEVLDECIETVRALANNFVAGLDAHRQMSTRGPGDSRDWSRRGEALESVTASSAEHRFRLGPDALAAGISEIGGGGARSPLSAAVPGSQPFSCPQLLANISIAKKAAEAVQALSRAMEEFPYIMLSDYLRSLPTDARIADKLNQLLGPREAVMEEVASIRAIFDWLHASHASGFDVDSLTEAVASAVSYSFPKELVGDVGTQPPRESWEVPALFEPALSESLPESLHAGLVSSFQGKPASARTAPAALAKFFGEAIEREVSSFSLARRDLEGRRADSQSATGLAGSFATGAAIGPADTMFVGGQPLGPVLTVCKRSFDPQVLDALSEASEALSGLTKAISDFSKCANYIQQDVSGRMSDFIVRAEEAAAGDQMREEAAVLGMEWDYVQRLQQDIDKRVEGLRSAFQGKIEVFQKMRQSLRDDAATYCNIESPSQFAVMYSSLLSVYRCSVCKNALVDTCLERCGHIFCHSCLAQIFEARSKKCPLCKLQFTEREMLSFPHMDFD